METEPKATRAVIEPDEDGYHWRVDYEDGTHEHGVEADVRDAADACWDFGVRPGTWTDKGCGELEWVSP